MTLLDAPIPPPTLAAPAKLMTTAELLAIPDDGIERWLINGQLREGTDVSRRSFRHSGTMTNTSFVFKLWLRDHPEVGGRVLTGDAGFQLTDDPDSTCGIDVAYISRELDAATPPGQYLIRGVPTLAVEIESASDTAEQINEKIDAYLMAGVPHVWWVDPAFRTVTVYRPDAPPKLFNIADTMDAEPHLPGFRAAVGEIFG